MILRALHKLARQEELVGDADYEMKLIAWLVRVDKGGKLLSIEGTHVIPEAQGRGKPTPVPKAFSVPRQPIRTSGDLAFFLCDKSEYVFGLRANDEATKKRSPTKLARRFALFRELVVQCAEATGDEGARAVATLLESVAAGRRTIKLPAECASNELFAFVYAPDVDRLVHHRDAIREYWKARRRTSAAGADEGEWQRCLVTGETIAETENFPQLKKVPGGTPSGVALVSFNSKAFESYGWSGNENAPISRSAAETCGTALNRLLDPTPPDPRPGRVGQKLPRRNFRISEDTIACFWASDRRSDPFLNELPFLMTGEDPDKVGDLYRSLWKGRPVELDDPSSFYALTLSGTQGRAIVRDWYETTVAEVVQNLARHFDDLQIVRNTPPPKGRDLSPQLPLRALLGALAPLGKQDEIPPTLSAGLIHAALCGTPYPFSLLQRALERMRAEIGQQEWTDLERRDARAALIKAVLRRTSSFKEVTPSMDPTNVQPGYLLGRLMATIERLQQVALGDVNAGVVDRYFAAASATPRGVFTRLLKNARHHARKAKDDPQTAGGARWLDHIIDEIASRFDPQHNGFPAYLDLSQQGLFVLGYHHQRHWLWLSKEERERLTAQPSATVNA